MFAKFSGNERQPNGQGVRFLAAMGFHVGDDDVASGFQFALGRLEHGVRFAHAGAHAEKDLETTAPGAGRLALDRCEQGVGIGALAVVHTFSIIN